MLDVSLNRCCVQSCFPPPPSANHLNPFISSFSSSNTVQLSCYSPSIDRSSMLPQIYNHSPFLVDPQFLLSFAAIALNSPRISQTAKSSSLGSSPVLPLNIRFQIFPQDLPPDFLSLKDLPRSTSSIPSCSPDPLLVFPPAPCIPSCSMDPLPVFPPALRIPFRYSFLLSGSSSGIPFCSPVPLPVFPPTLQIHFWYSLLLSGSTSGIPFCSPDPLPVFPSALRIHFQYSLLLPGSFSFCLCRFISSPCFLNPPPQSSLPGSATELRWLCLVTPRSPSLDQPQSSLPESTPVRSRWIHPSASLPGSATDPSNPNL